MGKKKKLKKIVKSSNIIESSDGRESVDYMESTYDINTEEIVKSERNILKKFGNLFSDIEYKVNQRKRNKLEIKELGLHEGFNPQKTYDVKSREVGIKSWKDFFIVYVMMIITIICFIAFLVRTGYLENPLNQLKQKENEVIIPVEEISNEEEIEDIRNYVLSYFPKENSIVDGDSKFHGECSINYNGILIEIFDNEDNLIYSEKTDIVYKNTNSQKWELKIDIRNSPKSNNGYVKISGLSDETTQKVIKTYDIIFHTVSIPEAVKQISPIYNQKIVLGTKLEINADIELDFLKDFSYKILNKNENLLQEGILIIKDKSIRDEIEIMSNDTWGEYGSLQVLSNNEVLMETPIRFK